MSYRHDQIRWNERYRVGRGPRQRNPRLERLLPMLRQGLVLDLAGGVGANVSLFRDSTVILVDISDEALRQAQNAERVQADAGALSFAPGAFDTIVCAYFFDSAIDLAALLKPGGTLFFETYTVADIKYRPDFNPAHHFDPAKRDEVFRGFDILLCEETDDGTRAYATLIGRKKT